MKPCIHEYWVHDDDRRARLQTQTLGKLAWDGGVVWTHCLEPQGGGVHFVNSRCFYDSLWFLHIFVYLCLFACLLSSNNEVQHQVLLISSNKVYRIETRASPSP